MTGPTRRAVVAGAGLAGSLAALTLARAGWDVEVHERRPDPRVAREVGGRSFNLGLSARGMAALEHVGLLDEVLAMTVPMRGRYIHDPDGDLHFQPYGTRGGEILHSLERADLGALLVEHAERTGRVRLVFGSRVVDVDPTTGTLTVRPADLAADDASQDRVVGGDLVVAADGAFSAVRAVLEDRGEMTTRLDTLDWGYKELTIPVGADGSPRTPLEGLHVWPAEQGLVVAHPNRDGSLTATLFLPLEDDAGSGRGSRAPGSSIASLEGDAEAVERYFATAFPDTDRLVPHRVREFLEHPTGRLVTVRTGPWAHRGRLVLVGDACHAVYPFFGQGMNSSFEDVLVLDRCLAAHPADLGTALAVFEHTRKPHTDALAELSTANFDELRRRVASPWFRFRKRADLVLHRAFPRAWVPLYTMVSHRTTPYADARARARRQDAVLAGVLGLVGVAGTVGAAAVTAAVRPSSQPRRPRGRSRPRAARRSRP